MQVLQTKHCHPHSYRKGSAVMLLRSLHPMRQARQQSHLGLALSSSVACVKLNGLAFGSGCGGTAALIGAAFGVGSFACPSRLSMIAYQQLPPPFLTMRACN